MNMPFTVKMIYLYAALLPVAPAMFRIVKGVEKIQLSDAVFIVMLFSWILSRIKKGSLFDHSSRRALYFIIGAFLAVTLFSFRNSVNLIHSAVDWVGISYLALLFIIIISEIKTREAFIGLLAAYSAGSVIAALAGLSAEVLYFITKDIGNNPLIILNKYEASLLSVPRIRIFFHTPNMFASFEHVGFIAMSAFFLLTEKGSSLFARSVKAVLIIAVVASVFLTGSQTLGGFAVTLFIASFILKGKIMSAVRYALFSIMAAILLFAICATVWMIYPVSVNAEPQTKDLNIRINYAYSYHIIPSMYAMSMLKEHPVIGVGIGTFADRYPKYINMDIEKVTAAKQGVPPYIQGLDPHNTYSGALAEWGILGFMSMLSIFAYMFMAISSRSLDRVRIVLLAGLVGMLVNALFIDSMMLRHFWLFMAFIIVFDNIGRKAWL